MLYYGYVFGTALVASLLMVPLLQKWAVSSGAVDKPDARKVHRHSTPRIGGIAIFMAALFAILVFVELGRELRGLLAGGLILFFTGLIDDLYGISPKRKFLGEIAACIIAMGTGGFYITSLGDLFGFGAIVLPPWLAVPFTLFAVVGVINAINLIDGLDGLAGGVSVIALAAFFLLGLLDGNPLVMAVCAAALGGILGFLKYNFYPARIFMGDVGSLVIGFLLAFTAIALTQGEGRGVAPGIPLMVLGLPIVDAVFVMCRRMLQGNSPFAADMSHVHHKFLSVGFHHRLTVLVLYGIALFWAGFSIVFRGWPVHVLLTIFGMVTAVSYLALRYLLNRRKRSLPLFPPRAATLWRAGFPGGGRRAEGSGQAWGNSTVIPQARSLPEG